MNLSPSQWPRIPLESAFSFQEGPGLRKWQFQNAGVKILNVSNIEKSGRLALEKSERYLDPSEAYGKYKHFLVDAGDLVIASSGISFDDDGLLRTRGVFVEERHLPLCMNTSTIRFKCIDNKSDLGFLRFWIDSVDFRSQISKLVTGSAQQNFGPSHLRAISIPLPPLAEQRRIAAVLDQANELRQKRQRAIDLLDKLPQSIFIEMFGDPVANLKGLPTRSLGDLIKVRSGDALIGANQNGGVYPVFGGNGVNGWHDQYLVPADTIIIGRVGVYCGAVHVTDRNSWVTDNALIVEKKSEALSSAYLATALNVAARNDVRPDAQ